VSSQPVDPTRLGAPLPDRHSRPSLLAPPPPAPPLPPAPGGAGGYLNICSPPPAPPAPPTFPVRTCCVKMMMTMTGIKKILDTISRGGNEKIFKRETGANLDRRQGQFCLSTRSILPLERLNFADFG